MEEPPEYPPGLCFSIPEQHLEDLDIDDAVPGAVVKFGAMVEATSCHHTEDACRIEASIKMVSIDGGPYVEVDSGPCICLNENDHEKLDLEQGCERGDLGGRDGCRLPNGSLDRCHLSARPTLHRLRMR